MNYLQTVGTLPSANTAAPAQAAQPEIKEILPMTPEQQAKLPGDTFDSPAKAPVIGRFRLLFKRLTKEQIKQVNETGMLPPTARFYNSFGYYSVGNKFVGLTSGTRKLPAGFELKQNFLGFTRVVPKGTTGVFVRKTKEEKAQMKAEQEAYKTQVAAEKEAKKADKETVKPEKETEKSK